MTDEIIVQPTETIVVETSAETTPVVIEVTAEPIAETTIAEPDAALSIHMLQSGVGGHIPVNGISQGLVVGLIEELLEMRSLIDEASVVKSPFLSNTIADLNLPGYYYYGGNRNDGQWQINRESKGGLIKSIAIPINNPAYTTFAEAWEVRSTLIYMVG